MKKLKFFEKTFSADEPPIITPEDLQQMATSEIVVGISCMVAGRMLTEALLVMATPLTDKFTMAEERAQMEKGVAEANEIIDNNLELLAPELDRRLLSRV